MENISWVPIGGQMKRGKHWQVGRGKVSVKIQTVHVNQVHRVEFEGVAN
jgi:hypothetical protein